MLLSRLDFESRRKVCALSTCCNQIGEVPVDIERLRTLAEPMINREIRVDVLEEPTKYHGMLIHHRDWSTILLRSSDIPYQQRFTFGHELGHILYSYDFSGEYPHLKNPLWSWMAAGRSEERRENEEICDEIAMYLLCPFPEVVKLLRGFHQLPYQPDLFQPNSPETTLLERMTDYFEVPTSYFKGYFKQLKKSLWKKPEEGPQ